MYESFFGFSARPFAAAPSPTRYFPGASCEAARSTLARCLERAEGAGLVIGPAGSGKTLLCQVLAEQFRGRFEVALLASGRLCTRRALLQAILFELGLNYRGLEEGDLRLALIDHLSPRGHASEAAAKAGLFLAIDEAHTLPLRLLEELRLITNLVRGGEPRVRLLLSGGPQLEERLASPKLESFNQRIAARCYLESLDRAQTVDYVKLQIEHVAGQVDAVFTADAIQAVYGATDGIPRLVNQVCDHALLLACAGGVKPVHAAGIEEAWADLQQLPMPWNSHPGAPQKGDGPSVVEFGELDEEIVDDLPHAVPFRQMNSDVETFEPIERIQQIEAQLAAIDDDFEPVGSIRPEVELTFQSTSNPFHESFDEEEIVLDRFTSLQTDVLADRPVVRSAESRELNSLLSPHLVPSKPAVAVAAATWPGGKPSEKIELPPAQVETKSVKTAPARLQYAGEHEFEEEGWLEVPAKSKQTETFQPVVNPTMTTATTLQQSHSQTMSDSDDDLIVIDDEIEVILPAAAPPARVRRQEYKQLFAQLRRG